MNKKQQLYTLHETWIKKCSCKLRKTATQAVPGDGNPLAEIVFIGEAPGKQEDIHGRPFLGAAGKFLNEMLESIKMKRENIYITNIVKYRPPNNRDPLPEEKDACRDWLHEELNLIHPKLIVFLGRHSMNDFFPEFKISETHGKLIAAFPKVGPWTSLRSDLFPAAHFLPLYHPAAAMYNGSLRKTLIKDFKKIPKILEKI